MMLFRQFFVGLFFNDGNMKVSLLLYYFFSVEFCEGHAEVKVFRNLGFEVKRYICGHCLKELSVPSKKR